MSATHPELLERLTAAKLSDREVERRVPLPQAFISKARKGGCASTKAEASWSKLRAWLDQNHPVAGAEAAAPPATAPRQIGEELQALILGADTLEKLEVVSRRVMLEIALGHIDRGTAPLLTNQQKERRMLLLSLEEQRIKTRGAGPTRVEIVWLTDWRNEAEDAKEDEAEDEAAPGSSE